MLPCLAEVGSPLNDRVIGCWGSSTGAILTISYTGQPESFEVQVDDASEYTGYWTSSNEFSFSIRNTRVLGSYDPRSGTITLRDEQSAWLATWSRRA